VRSHHEVLERAGKATPFSQLLNQIPAHATQENPLLIEHVAGPAHAFVCGMIASHMSKIAAPGRLWILAKDLRLQENVFNELTTWWGRQGTLFFPEQEINQFVDALPDPDIAAERTSLLQQLAADSRCAAGTEVVVLIGDSLEEDVPRSTALESRELVVKMGDTVAMEALTRQLQEGGYEKSPEVYQRGQFALRGGIFDIYSWQSATPVRIELFGDEVESLRTFDLDTQASIQKVKSVQLLLSQPDPDRVSEFCKLRDYVGADDVVVSVDWHEFEDAHVHISSGAFPGSDTEEDHSAACYDSPIASTEAGDFIVQQAKRDGFRIQVETWCAEGWEVCMFFNKSGEVDRFQEVVSGDLLGKLITPRLGNLNNGFTVPGAKLAVLSDAEVFGRYQHARARRIFNKEKQETARRVQTDWRDMSDGDIVVHAEQGIGRFLGLMRKDGKNGDEDMLGVEFADQAKLYVPLEHAHLITRYVGAGRASPNLSKLGSGKWLRARQAAQRSILEYAGQLLEMQAERETAKSFSHPEDTKWQWEFENSFIYKETPDQLRAILETKRDMENLRPMDRLICGDVGFGKTEVAIRAAFKAVMGGRQVAMLVPTTVLAQQHFKNFKERMSDYPITLGLLSRFRSPKQQRSTLKGLVDGSVDIVIGTHRLISKDVSFKKLGLVVIDEEQRFGVSHKERFKELFRMVDVLTLSATPIPRTLYLSLMGARDMSTIETAPPNRYPVVTSIVPYDERVIREAINRELKRKGQVFFLHNRVKTINAFKQKIEKLCPKARVEVGHGQMDEKDLEAVMQKFVNGGCDVFVCTTIIESGIDIPNANTIIIDRADMFGLADLYQLRGRVGRAGHRAYAILMLPRHLVTVGDARKRINAIKQYSSLGSGFKIAMRDLEIRGAGNLLGTQQSGHIMAVGFDLYCKMLKKAVAQLQGKQLVDRPEVALRIDFITTNEAEYQQRAHTGILPSFISEDYIPDARMRISAYRMISEAATLKELKTLKKNWRDRFGVFPPSVENLLSCIELKIACANVRITSVEIEGSKLKLMRNGTYVMLDGKFPRLTLKVNSEEMLAEAIALLKQF
ncbi:MAG: transcription-repair coupling factor (superfamily II helicase), partial [Verrucomicrobiales bacterium]